MPSVDKNSSEFACGLPTFIPGVPVGLEYLHNTNTVFLKPYSGPHVVGHYSPNNVFELLNAEGHRIFMVSNNFTPKIKLRMSEESSSHRKLYPVTMSVVNYMEDEVFQYYGVPGQMLKAGPYKETPWGQVTKRKGACISALSGYLHYDVGFDPELGKPPPADRPRHRHWSTTPPAPTFYVIEGSKSRSCCPSESSRKLYLGNFECGIYGAKDKNYEAIGTIGSDLGCERLGVHFPGIEFPEGIDVLRKSVLIAALFVDVIRQW